MLGNNRSAELVIITVNTVASMRDRQYSHVPTSQSFSINQLNVLSASFLCRRYVSLALRTGSDFFTLIPLTNGEYNKNVLSTGPVLLIVFLIRNRVIGPLFLTPMQMPVNVAFRKSFSGTTCKATPLGEGLAALNLKMKDWENL